MYGVYGVVYRRCVGVCGYGVRCAGVGCTYGVRCVCVVWCTLCVRCVYRSMTW